MRQPLKTQVLDALRQSLRDLESVKLVSAEDGNLELLKQELRLQIVQLENGHTPDRYYQTAA
jgi:hypothetical protein